MSWAGFEIAALSFGFDTMPPALVHEYTTHLLLFRGAATLAGGLVGSLLLPLFVVTIWPVYDFVKANLQR